MPSVSAQPVPREAAMQVRTPPDVKWLLNERAALAGEHDRAVAKQGALQDKVEKLERQLAKAIQQRDSAGVAASRARASMDALDTTMALVNSQVEPTYAGVVAAWAGKYGTRGALGKFVEDTLRQAAPAPITTTVLIDLASRQFGLAFTLPADRRSFRKSVSSALTALLTRDRIEPLHSREGGSHGLWRWKDAMPGLEALRSRARGLATRQPEAMQQWP